MNKIASKFDLGNKVAIVTGASKGIGKSIAQGLAENGARVVVSSRKQEAVDQVAREFREAGLQAIGIQCHVGDAQERKGLVEKTLAEYGQIDVLVNNAAINISNMAPGTPIKVRGFVTPFGHAPEVADFDAQTIIDVADVTAVSGISRSRGKSFTRQLYAQPAGHRLVPSFMPGRCGNGSG